MKNTQKKFLSAVLAASSVAGVVAPAVTAFAATATEVETLVASALKDKTFYSFNVAYGAILSLPAADQGKYLAQIAPLEAVVKTADIANILKEIDKFYAVGTSTEGDMSIYDNVLYKLIPAVPAQIDREYLQGELGKWGMKFITEKQPEYIAATDAIIAVTNATNAGKLDEAKTLLTAAQAAIAKVVNANNKAYLTTVTLPDVVKNLDAAVAKEGIKITSITATDVTGATANLPATNIASNSSIVIKVGKELDKTTVNPNNIYVTKGNVREAVSVTYDKAEGKITVASLATDKFQGGKDYTVTIAKDVKDVAGNAQAADLTYTFATAVNPVVLSYSDDAFGTTLVNGDVVDSNSTDLRVRFNKDMDTTTFNTSNVKLYNITDDKYVAVTVAAVSGSSRDIQINVGASTIFETDKKYKLVVTPGVKDLAGNAVGKTYELTLFPFGTSLTLSNEKAGDSTFTSKSATNVYNQLTASSGKSAFKFLAQFSKAVDVTTFDGNIKFVEKTATGDVDVPYTVSYETGSMYINIVPKADLKEEAQYEITLGKNIKSTEGLALATDTVYKVATGDFTKPTVVGTTPSNGGASVATDGDIVINFNEKILASTLSLGTNVKVNDVTNGNTPVTISGWLSSLSADGKTLTITPDKTGTNNLKPNTTYSLVLEKAVTDDAATPNQLADKVEVIFTTAQSSAPAISSVQTGNYDSTGTARTTGVTAIDKASKFYFTFDKALDVSSAASTYVKLEAQVSGIWTTVTAPSVSFDNSNKSILVDASGTNFNTDTKYRVTISSSLKEKYGTQLGNDYVFEFTTGTKPSVNTGISYPNAFATNVSLTSPYVAVAIGDAENALDKSTLNVNNVKFVNKADGTDAPYTLKYVNEAKDVVVDNTAALTAASDTITLSTANANVKVGSILQLEGEAQVYVVKAVSTNGLSITLDRAVANTLAGTADVTVKSGVVFELNTNAKLASNTEYQVKVSKVTDAVGNALGDTTFTVRTVTGATNLAVSSSTMTDGSTGIAVDAALEVVFNTALDSATVNPATTIVPTAALTANANTVVLSATDANIAVGSLVKFGGESEVFVVTAVTPDAAPATTVTVTLDRKVTTTNGTASVQYITKNITVTDVTNNVDVTDNFDISRSDVKLVVAPKGLLKADTTYKVTIGTGLKNTSTYGSDGLDSAKSYTFHTEQTASVAPKILTAVYFDTNGDKIVNAGDVVRVTFNTKIDSATFDGLGDFTLAGPGLTIAGTSAAYTVGNKYVDITLAAAGAVNPSLAVGVTTIKVNTDAIKDYLGTSESTSTVTITAYTN